MSDERYKKGDWVSYMRDNGIAHGEVMYSRIRPGGYVDIYTTNGMVSQDSVLEVRRSNTAEVKHEEDSQ